MRNQKQVGKLNTTLIFIILILFAIISGVVCYFIYYTATQEKSADIVFTYSNKNNDIEIDNSSPITDELGKQIEFTPDILKTGYAEISVSANMVGMSSIDYEIVAKDISSVNEISANYIKIYLTDADTDKPLSGYTERNISSFKDFKVAATDPGAKRLFAGKLKKGEVKNFRLRMWLADTYTINNELRNFKINLKVNVID